MSLTNAGLTVAPTSYTVTGGTALTFNSMGPAVNGKVTLYVPADTDLRLRRTIDASVKTPAVNLAAPNGWTQARASVLFKKPKLLANGRITVNTARVELAFDPETTQTEITELVDIAAQTLIDADFTSFWKALALT